MFVKANTWLSYNIEKSMENSIQPVYDLSLSSSTAISNL